MKRLLRKWIQTLVAAALGASTCSVATAALLAGGQALASGVLFIGLGTLVTIAACAAADRS